MKYYYADLGLLGAASDFSPSERIALLENAVCNKLILRGYRVDTGRVQYRVKNREGKMEKRYLGVDFVAQDTRKQMYIQVAKSLDDPESREKEIAPLLRIRDGFRKVILVDQDVPDYYTPEGIRVMSIQDFLLKNF